MKITQMKFQKIVVKVAVILSAILLFYAVGIFASSLGQFQELQAYIKTVELSGGVPKLDRAAYDLWINVQPFNRTLFTLTLINLFATLSLLVFFSHTRRKYYISNYITTGVATVMNLVVSIFAIANIVSFRSQFIACDIEKMNEIAQTDPTVTIYEISEFSSSTWSFDLGLVLFIFACIMAVLLVLNAVWKFINMKKEKAEFAEIDAQIYASWEAHEKELLKEADSYET